VIVNQRLLCIFDRAFDRLQLLSDLRTWTSFLNHFDNRLQVAIRAFQAANDGGMMIMTRHL
jgi:hypothetical protein